MSKSPAVVITVDNQLLAALDEARNGLLWYRDSFPGAVDGSDDEAMTRIDAALARGQAAEALARELFDMLDKAITHGHLVSWQQRRRELVATLKESMK